MSASKEPTPLAAVPPKRSKLRLLMIVAVVLAGAGGGGAYWWTRHQPVAAEAQAHDAPASAAPNPADSSLLKLDTFTVNLADPGVSRFPRVTVQLVLQGKGTGAELEHDPLAVTRVRSAVLELLTTQQSASLITPEGKTTLKAEIATRVSGIVGHEVTDVLFSDFVVQF